MPTNKVNLEQIARAISAASPDFDDGGRRIVHQTFRLLARGEGASPAAIAEAADLPTREVEDRLRSWPGVFWDGDDRVTRFWGLSIDRLEPSHRMEVNGRTLFAWCAWDTLFLTGMLGSETRVESADPATGEPIRLTVTPEGVESVRPEGAAVSFLFPDGPFGPDAVQSFCHFVYFFASRRSGERWVADHPGTFLLSVNEAFELGRLTNRMRWGKEDARDRRADSAGTT